MTTTKLHDQRMAELTFASVYPHYISKVERKGRTVQELNHVITWLTGFGNHDLDRAISEKWTFERFFSEAKLPKEAEQIKGVICGYRIEDIATPLTKKVRYLDKLVDELAKGKKMEKIIRQ